MSDLLFSPHTHTHAYIDLYMYHYLKKHMTINIEFEYLQIFNICKFDPPLNIETPPGGTPFLLGVVTEELLE